ncbi:B-type cyclin [Coemansia sp. RSA 1365]|nr:B-type cyclin [Coemansia sp. RSA 1365]
MAPIPPTVYAFVFSASNIPDASNTTATSCTTSASTLLDTPDTLAVLATPSAQVTPVALVLTDTPAALADTDTHTFDTVADRRASTASTVTVVVPEAPEFVTKTAIDYAADHVGLLGEQPISAAEIAEFEKDAGSSENSPAFEYSDDIFGYMREREFKLTPDSDYIERQPEMTWKSRALMIEWLVMQHKDLGLQPETLYLCTNLVDRCLSKYVVDSVEYILIGAVCLFIAAKYEEGNYLGIADIMDLFSNRVSKAVIIEYEQRILGLLNYDIGWDGPLAFMQRITIADGHDATTHTLAKYLAEEMLIDQRFVGLPSSKVAAVAYYLSHRLLDKGPWTRKHAFYSGYFESELTPLAANLLKLLPLPRKHTAVYDKYARKRYSYASETVQELLEVSDLEKVFASSS